MNDAETTLAEARAEMAAFIAERDWEQFHQPKNLAMSIAIEAAELMEHFQWKDHGQAAKAMADADFRREVQEEMADTFSYLLSLANALDVDLAACFEAKMQKNRVKYPDGEFQP
jgi:NTP pyrophosphatase (non-canonical NTP hydrolase)